VLNIVACKNVDVDVDVCFMEEVVEITAGDIRTVCKDERGGDRKRESAVFCDSRALCMR
jgi:hypothetical protein